MLVLYHGDLDGKCSGFWVNCKAEKDKYPTKFIEMNYDKDFDVTQVKENETVWIVDFHIVISKMEELLKITSNVIWIDHHQTSIDKYKDFKVNIKGIRKVGTAACVLTYKYLHSNDLKIITPMFTKYIGDRDVWKFDYGERTNNFCMGFSAFDNHPQSIEWLKAMKSTLPYEEIGKNVIQYKNQWARDYLSVYTYKVKFEGRNCLVVNIGKSGSEIFGDEISNYDIVISYIFNGKQYIVSLYSEKINVSEIAKKYKGGGHKGASGFVCDKLPF